MADMTTHKETLKLALAEFENQKAGLEEVGVTDHSLDELITAIKKALAQPNEKEAALLRALEIIAVGDANNPQAQAAEELIALGYWRDIPEAIALAQPISSVEQEPVALETVYETIIQWDEGGGKRSRRELARRIVSLYTTPPQRKPLTEQFIMDSTRELSTDVRWPSTFIDVWRLCEAAHGIKGEA